VTRLPEVIRGWAEDRDAVPAAASRGRDGRPRTLSFDCPMVPTETAGPGGSSPSAGMTRRASDRTRSTRKRADR